MYALLINKTCPPGKQQERKVGFCSSPLLNPLSPGKMDRGGKVYFKIKQQTVIKVVTILYSQWKL